MSEQPPSTRYPTQNGHYLVAVEEYLPGHAPTDYDVELGTSREYLTRYWRCRNCGQERNRRREFTDPCEGEPTSLLVDGGYTVEDGRTRRALTEQMGIGAGDRVPTYMIEGDHSYSVNINEPLGLSNAIPR